MAGDPHAGINGENALEAGGSGGCAIRNDDLAGVQAVANADAAAVVEANPGSPADGIDQGVEDGPVGNGVGAVAHAFRFAVGAGDGTGVEVVAANDDGGFDDAAGNQFVELQSGTRAFTVSQPANSCRQSLKMHLLLRHLDPAMQRFIVREEFQNSAVRGINILRVAAEGYPTEWPLAFAKERTNVSGNKAGVAKCVGDAMIKRPLAQVIAIVKHNRSAPLHFHHCRALLRHRFHGKRLKSGGIAVTQFAPIGKGKVVREISERIVRRGLVGDDIGNEVAPR